jgi:formylglycine-generating enzyme required for sulfatase activity
MKQNYKFYLCALLLVAAVSMKSASVHAASMAVLVVGLETNAASDAFAQSIRYEFTQKGYEMVTTAAVTAKLKELRDKHAEGKPVDTVGLAAWGKTNSIDFVQLVVEKGCDITVGGSTVSGREQLSQVVTCRTTKYTERAMYRTRFVPSSSANPNLGTDFEEMIFVAGGVFEMGCKGGRDDKTTSCLTRETPVHWVRVNSFYIGKYEVTQGLWKKVMGSLPSSISGNLLDDDKPVVFVPYTDIEGTNGFLATLNAQTGRNYRLPTEAEWEYAARGCTVGVCGSLEFSGSGTIGDVAWYANNCSILQPVGQKLPNALGIYDMSGNVWECCSDIYDESYYPSGTTQTSPQDNPTGPDSGTLRTHRGGGWNGAAYRARAAARDQNTSDYGDRYVGFRLILPEFR